MNDTLCSMISTCSWCLYCCCYRYLENNIRCLETVRAYDDTVPEFLRNRPRRLVNHCIRRLPPSVEEIPSHCVTVVAENTYMVRSRDRQYQVSCSDSLASCECIDWQLNFMPCKHMLAVCLLFGWNCLPEVYRNFPIFTLDDAVVQQSATAQQDVSDDDASGSDTLTASELHVSSDVEPDSLLSQQPADHVIDMEPQSPQFQQPADQFVDVEPQSLQSQQPADQLIDVEPQSPQSQQPADPLVDVSKLQSNVRQSLSALASLTYTTTDVSYLQQVQSLLQQHLVTAKGKVGKSSVKFPARNRRRCGKRDPHYSSLKRMLTTLRTRKHMKKLRRRRANVVTGTFICNYHSYSVSFEKHSVWFGNTLRTGEKSGGKV